MAVYNGGQFLSEQIESILDQTVQDFVLYIHDDCSADNSFAIARGYAELFPLKIKAKQNETNSGGAQYNFIRMMTEIRDDYVMLCDQDDIWLPEKIEVTLGKMRELESRYTKDAPLLVHTDLRVIDESGAIISPSYKKMMQANYKRTQLKDVVIQNTVLGCTALYNRSLAGLFTKEPPYMIMHDWWLELTAAALGQIGYTDEAPILYRQHKNNVIGAGKFSTMKYKIGRLVHYGAIKEALTNTYWQAESLLELYRERLTKQQQQLLTAYCSIPSLDKLSRLLVIYRLGTLKTGLSRKIAHFIFI
ncbi:glycosyl transferase [Spirochaetia bacterium]|nr:glycosyl transferase [Spirochaetia bacterium]